MSKRLTVLILTLLLAVAFAGWRPSTAEAQDNVVVAVNTKDGTSLIDFAFKIVRVSRDVVDQSNAAAAVASCEECEAIAAAFQIVLVFSNPSVVTPENLALALNVECTECLAFASAYQWVLGTDGPAGFTNEGKERLSEIKKQLHDLEDAAEDMTLEELIAALEAIQAEIADVLATELVPVGKPEEPSTSTTTTEPAATTTEPETTTTEPAATSTEPAGTTTSP
jgi:putative peptide zinc metalloprotease protein